ncbi:glycosyltransferase family 39 protein [Streptomyces sp. VRA16 Mangrove soil]|uniref:glycosyltransferase family 39 protein n=1 Tax=Streptomyces sp. VRA16 Mangrove soil TaxID=2817434 RepID=UPI001A9CDDBE|nr:glycosyltransferase family 39 protein [Streptomyces sp. VRA16 Mangrove soil]MBO1332337.1 glycosyltransferase family 39 protein [Streptomyces sp. VRA16 Mangrove soil]
MSEDEQRAVGTLAPVPRRPLLMGLALHAGVLGLLSARYGYHRDELYFREAGHHLDWGYVDQPPLTPLLARASTAVFGDSLVGLRVGATLAATATVLVVALIARELGGGRGPQLLAAALAALGAQGLAVGHMVSTATFDLLVWVTVSLLVLRVLRGGDRRWWLAVGAVVGLGVQNKYLVVLLVAVLLAAIAWVGPREVLRSRWLAGGAVLALALAAPNVVWQATHGWPQFTVARGISEDDGAENRVLLVPQQLIYLSPLFVPVWVAGWRRLWRADEVRWARAFAVAYPLLCVIVLVAGGKGYYTVPLLVVLLAAGCGPTLRWARAGRARVRRALLAGVLVLSAAINSVIVLPVLPPDALTVPMALDPEQGEQLGWPELADATRQGWTRIPVRDRSRAVLFTVNYGEAGALDRYGPARGLPRPYSGHMSYADWGPPPDAADGPVLLVRQTGDSGIEGHFSGCRTVARVDNGHDVDNEEQNGSVVLCSGPHRKWSALWPSLRHAY